MDKIVNLSDADRLEMFQITSSQLGIPVVMVEKDFWVCWSLERIFSDAWLCKYLRFRGGTSLSKGYDLIKRFSEDIDLTLDKDLVLTTEANKRLLRSKKSYKENKDLVSDMAAQYIKTTLKDKIAAVLGDVVKIYTDEKFNKIIGAASEQKNNNKNLHIVYPTVTDKTKNDEYIRQDILLEVGILSALTPNEMRSILPFVAEVYKNLEIRPINVPTIQATRTFWDKATILHREYYRPATKKETETGVEKPNHTPERYSRHYHDLYKMGHSAIKNEALKDHALLQEVIDYKNQFYPCGWGHTFDECATGGIHLLPNDNNYELLKQDYISMRNMIYGDVPRWEEIMDYLAELEKEINNKYSLSNEAIQGIEDGLKSMEENQEMPLDKAFKKIENK